MSKYEAESGFAFGTSIDVKVPTCDLYSYTSTQAVNSYFCSFYAVLIIKVDMISFYLITLLLIIVNLFNWMTN